MRILKLTLNNFKGITAFTLDTKGGNVSVFGDNATGKTTIFDAVTWLLFDKDSQNKKDFQIKTLDSDGQVIHGLSHEVEGVFDLSGRTLTLRKVYAEKWTKKRGQATAEFTGHTTDHFIDGVPVQKKEYDVTTAGIADENIFKLLTSPTYFNEQVHWQKRRSLLLEVCGDLTDEEVIASDKTLAKLPDILQGRKLEDHRKVIAAKRAEINKELEKIPVRIDEANRGLPDISGIATETLSLALADLKAAKQTKEQAHVRIVSGGEGAIKQRRLMEVEGEILEIQNEHRTKVNDAVSDKRIVLNQSRERIAEIYGDIRGYERRRDHSAEAVRRIETEIAALRERWHEVDAWKFEYADEGACPTCGQDLPEERLAEARETALAIYNRNKAQTLESINAAGKKLKADLAILKEEMETLRQNVLEAEKLAEAESVRVVGLQAEIDALAVQNRPVSENPAYTAKTEERIQLEKEIAQLQAGNQDALQRVRNELADLDIAIGDMEEAARKVKAHKDGQTRITELKTQERELAAEFERLEGELYLTEQFIRTKVNLLEGKINSKFKYARFKLFEQQVNGGLQEVCETLFSGVPYSSGLNNAARINVGLDIINTLSQHYGFDAPIWIDNREAVTKLTETRGQLISLVVSEPDKTLRVEIESKDYKEDI